MANNPKKLTDPADEALTAIQQVLNVSDEPAEARASEPEPVTLPSSVRIYVVPDQYPTIQAAIDAAEAGSIVLIKPGVYQEALKFKEGIELRGEKPETAVVRWTRATGPRANQGPDFSLLAIVDCQSGP